MGGIVSDVVGSITGSKQAGKAALRANREAMAAEQAMAEKNLAFQREMFDYQKGLAAPWQQAGMGALQEYQTGKFDPTSDPVYQQRLEEQSKAFGASGAASGMQLSGGMLKGLRDITGAELGASYDRRMARLTNLMNMGQGGMGQLFGASQQMGANIGNIYGTMGANQAQGFQNMGAIQAQQATAPFQDLMSMGTMLGGLGSGYGAMAGTALGKKWRM